MKKYFVVVIAVVMIFGLIGNGYNVTSSVVLKVAGTAEIKLDELTQWMACKEGMVVYKNNIIHTGAKSKLIILLDDGSKVVIYQNSLVTLKDLSVNNRLFRQDKGKTRVVVRKLAQGQQFRFTTPTAVCSVRGTEFGLEMISSKETVLRVFEGIVAAGKIGGTDVPVHPNQRLSILSDRPAENPVIIPQQEMKQEQINRFDDTAVEKGCSPRELVKLTKALLTKSVSGLDISAATDLVDTAVNQGLSAEEAVTIVTMQIVRKSGQLSGQDLLNSISNELTTRIAKRGDTMQDGKKVSATANEKFQSIIKERYTESGTSSGVTPPVSELEQRKMRR